MASREVVVEARGLRKHYDGFEAVAGIDFAVGRGECFGFLGPNGAGKTTTMRLVQAVAHPSAGTLRVLGLDPARRGKQVRARIGVCPQLDNLDPDLLVYENLMVYGRYFALPRRIRRERSDALLAFVSLTEKRDRKIAELSGGMKRRLVIARALVNEPELLILDEPTTGLDPQARHLIWQKLRELKSRGVTMLLTTHYMDEAERLCDRLVILDGGKILAEGAPHELIAEHVGEEVVELRIPPDQESLVTGGLDLDGVQSERAGDVRAFFLGRRSELADKLLAEARRAGAPCLLRNATLEDVFLKLTGRELRQ
jgi:lipooligosaccharide transport system ATP-binding protein